MQQSGVIVTITTLVTHANGRVLQDDKAVSVFERFPFYHPFLHSAVTVFTSVSIHFTTSLEQLDSLHIIPCFLDQALAVLTAGSHLMLACSH